MKRTIKLNESELKRMISESVKRVLRENDDAGALRELAKSINYFYAEAMQNLENLKKEYEKIPDEYSAMKHENLAMVRETISTLKLAYSGNKWQEEGPSLSTMARYPNVGRN